MKVLLIADPHVHPFPAFSELVEVEGHFISSRALDCVLALHWAYDIAVGEAGCSEVWVLGDLFHVSTGVNQVLMNLVKNLFQKFLDHGVHTRVVVGNHDCSIKSKFNLPEVLAPLIDHVYLEPTHSDDETCFASWFTKEDELPKGEVLFGHLAVEGAMTGPIEYIPPKGWSTGAFKQYQQVFLGHYHKAQTIGNIEYVGSLLQHDFGGRNDWVGVIMYDIESRKHTRIENTMSPRFVALTPEEIPERLDNCYVRVDVDRSANIERLREVINSRGAKGVVFQRVGSKTPTKLEESERVSHRSVYDVLREYVAKSSCGLNKERLLSVGETIVKCTELQER